MNYILKFRSKITKNLDTIISLPNFGISSRMKLNFMVKILVIESTLYKNFAVNLSTRYQSFKSLFTNKYGSYKFDYQYYYFHYLTFGLVVGCNKASLLITINYTQILLSSIFDNWPNYCKNSGIISTWPEYFKLRQICLLSILIYCTYCQPIRHRMKIVGRLI